MFVFEPWSYWGGVRVGVGVGMDFGGGGEFPGIDHL